MPGVLTSPTMDGHSDRRRNAMSTVSAGPQLSETREHALSTLSGAASTARLTLDEYAQRARAVHQAADADEIAAALADVRAPGAGPATEGRSWLVGILSGTEQRGRWRLAARLRIVALLGGVKLDLGAAEVQAPVSTITVLAVLGGAEITAPDGVSIQLSGVSVFGGRGDERSPGPPLPGSPLIRVRSFALFGGVKIRQAR
jgi:hypothetical protein